MSKRCLVTVEGGLGKSVMLTAILPELKKKYDEVYVVSPYFDVFKCCSAVTDAFPFGQGSLYQELVLDPDTDILWKEPYSNAKFIKKECHLFDAWAEEFGITLERKAMDYVPNLDKIREVFPAVAKDADKIKADLNNKYIIVQFCGGQSPLGLRDAQGNMARYNDHAEAIKRNYYKGEKLVALLQKKYPEHKILHFALPNEPAIEGTVKLEVPYLTYVLLADSAEKIVCTDSSLQHLGTGHCRDITVIWGETRPEHFGYSCNKNICAKHVLNSQPYFKPLGVSPSIVNMPEPEDVMKEVTK